VDHPFNMARLAYLRAELTKVRLEKTALAHEIQTPAIPIIKKLIATRRYAAADAEMKNVARELEAFIAVAKHAQATRGLASTIRIDHLR
jgi:hypothetical protein